MSLEQFGSSVDEVRRKLGEILPLVDAGEAKAKQLHERLDTDGPDWASLLDDIEMYSRQNSELMDTLEGRLNEFESQLSQADSENEKELAEAAKSAEDSTTSIESAQAKMEQELPSRESKLDEVTAAIDKNYTLVREGARKLLDELGEAREAYLNSRDEFLQKLSECMQNQNRVRLEYKEKEAKLREEDTPSYDSRMQSAIDDLQAVVTEMESKIDKGLEATSQEADPILQAIHSDLDGLIADYHTKYKEFLGEIPKALAQGCGQLKTELEGFADDSVQKLQDEIAEAQAVAETARQFLSDKSRSVVEGVEEAKNTADNMNQSM